MERYPRKLTDFKTKYYIPAKHFTNTKSRDWFSANVPNWNLVLDHFFHGKKDYVINYKQTKNFHNIVSKKNYSELYLFEDEGHGFKDMNNKVFVLQKTEIFLRKILNY